MTIAEEIEELKAKLERTDNEAQQAEVLLEILRKSPHKRNADTQLQIDRLLQLSSKLNSPNYRAWALHYLANLQFDRGDYTASTQTAREAHALFLTLNNRKGIADSRSTIANNYYRHGNYTEAMQNYRAALAIREETGDTRAIAHSFNNIANIHSSLGNYPEALKNYFASLKLNEQINYTLGMANCHNNIGVLYEQQGKNREALESHKLSLKLNEEIGYKLGIATSYHNIGAAYENLSGSGETNAAERHRMLESALTNYATALNIRQEIGDKYGLTNSYNNIGTVYERLANSPGEPDEKKRQNYALALKNYLTSLGICKEEGYKRGMAVANGNIGSVYSDLGNYDEALNHLHLSLKMSEELGDKMVIKESAGLLTKAYKAIRDFENALLYNEKYHEVEKEMFGEKAQQQLAQLSFQHDIDHKEKQLEIEQLRNVDLKREKERSESLLLNILPSEVAEELKDKGTAAARHFDNVTVLFTDFKGFTTVSEKLTPQQLVDELHACFSGFDAIISKYNIEKIKTVGDAYLAVSGLPIANVNHAEDMVKAAIEIRDFIANRKNETDAKAPFGGLGAAFEVRIGIHSGSVVAGIVGVKKFAYDIWGDTVNTAARMEQNGEAGKINISETTFGLVKDKFECEYRGEIDAKNKGKLKMYFVV